VQIHSFWAVLCYVARIHHFAKKIVSNYLVTLQLLENLEEQWTHFKEKQYGFTNIFGEVELIFSFLILNCFI
jgi:hypothetical protein